MIWSLVDDMEPCLLFEAFSNMWCVMRDAPQHHLLADVSHFLVSFDWFPLGILPITCSIL